MNRISKKIIYLDDAIDALAYFTEKSPTGRTAQEVVKDLPSAQPETLGMICGACDDCDSTVLYLTNPPQVKCKRSGNLHFVTDHCDAPSAQPKAEERTAESAQNVPNGDLVSRKAAIDEITEYGSGNTIYMSVVELKRRIEHLPSAQPEIIACGDCKHYLYPHGCGHIDGMVTAQEDGYCSYAERRGNETVSD